MDYTALIISILALGFTIFSFWWMNWRKGKILLNSNLRTYAACAKGNRLIIELPLIIHNTGAVPIVIENMRLYFPAIKEDKKYLFFNATVSKLGTDENRAFAKPFSISSGNVLELICEFQNTSTSFCFQKDDYNFEVQLLLGNTDNWKSIKTYTIHVHNHDVTTLNERFITHDNQK